MFVGRMQFRRKHIRRQIQPTAALSRYTDSVRATTTFKLPRSFMCNTVSLFLPDLPVKFIKIVNRRNRLQHTPVVGFSFPDFRVKSKSKTTNHGNFFGIVDGSLWEKFVQTTVSSSDYRFFIIIIVLISHPNAV